MVCIAAFIILAILGIFSADYRKLAGKAWSCVARRLTLRPCDVNFGEEIKGKVLGKLVLTHPLLYKFMKRWFDWLALVFVLLTIWSLVYVLIAGVNYLAYDTCNPQDAQSCSLSGQACSISSAAPGFFYSLGHGQIGQWAKAEEQQWQTTFKLLPARFKNWQPQQYLNSDNTFYYKYDPGKKVALELIDPGCKYCAELFQNIEAAGFANKYNLTYILYPIPDSSGPGGYKFANSYQMASWIEASKQFNPADPAADLKNAETPPDWQLLQRIFTNPTLQSMMDYSYNSSQVADWFRQNLAQIGYSQSQIAQIEQLAGSAQIKQNLQRNRQVVEDQIKTVKIPTIIFNGRRYDRLIGPDKLR